ncbi:MAG: argininosuccinate synthase [Apilactobacillus sp.]|uniref:argininosuccinate synthase n=1 Tax=Apilactobacillus TaxID=2767877 RepID=UPI0025CDA181|nr:argininosuccinate synthase [Apilactobacillus sp.]MCT6822730.1 argininosuccinate synthase [Apilactobacillus sp.]MCT6858232.1 argininosuccinate synthase [Apilactobacillus sp.]
MKQSKKIVLAYSGGLDTSVSIAWLIEQGFDVIACCINVGEDYGEHKDLNQIKTKALKVGAIKSYVVDALDEFAEDFLLTALDANAMYEGEYPLSSALSRPLMSQKLVEIAHQEGAEYICHGCTGKGNDQVRFDVAIHSLDPTIEVVTPVRQWHWNREEEIEFAKKYNIEIPIDLDSPYSIDANIWGRANECGVLENPWNQAPDDAFDITKPIEDTPDTPAYVGIGFHQGKPVSIDGQSMSFVDIIAQINLLAGEHGVGRIDHIENRLVGIKSREVYEAPGATVLIKAHQAMENLTMERDLAHFKPMIEQQIANLTYNGLWFSPLMQSLKAFIKTSQETVSGVVKLKLFKGNVSVVASKSDESLYDENLATYTSSDSFDQDASVGFIKLWGLPTQVASQVKQKNLQSAFLKDVLKEQSKEKVLVANQTKGDVNE